MARPCKAVGTQNRHSTKAEIQAREEQEARLRGLVDKVKPPTYLSKQQKKIFKNIVKELEASGILCNLDIYILATCSIAIDRLQEIEKLVNEDITRLTDSKLMSTKDKYQKDFFRCCNELSLSPQSRAKLGNLNIQAKAKLEDPVLQALGDDEDDYEEYENWVIR